MRIASLLLTGALVTAVSCSDGAVMAGPTSPEALTPAAATVFHDNFVVPVDEVVFVPCANGGVGEEVHLTGSLHVVVHETVNGNRFNVKLHFQDQGVSGIGLSTGDKYRRTGATQERFGGSFANGQFSDTFTNSFNVIGQGPGNNFLIHETFHVTFNANGDFTAFVDNFSVECK